MIPHISTIAMIVISYLIGSLSSAILVCHIVGLPDPRTQGSGNPGATNVLRFGGKRLAMIVLLGDLLKGLLPVLAAKLIGLNETGIALTAFAAFLGHLYPIYFQFQGGKGVATLLGCLLALSLPAGLCWMATWVLVALLSRYSSLSSLTATLLAPVYIWYFSESTAYTIVFALMFVVLLMRHRANIKKLLSGKESKIGKKI